MEVGSSRSVVWNDWQVVREHPELTTEGGDILISEDGAILVLETGEGGPTRQVIWNVQFLPGSGYRFRLPRPNQTKTRFAIRPFQRPRGLGTEDEGGVLVTEGGDEIIPE